jgi:hypothetical protein
MKFRRRRLIDRRTWTDWDEARRSETRSGGGLWFVVGAAEEIEHTVDDFFFG